MSIPTINLGKADGDPTTRAQLLHDLRHALFEVGFLYLSNHGIRESIVQDLVDALPGLFALSDRVKESVALVNSPHFLGYSQFGSEITARVRDQREQFEFANELPDRYGLAVSQRRADVSSSSSSPSPPALPLYIRLQGPNQWLDESGKDAVPRLREIVESYVAAMQDVAMRFLELVTEALDLPAHSLERFTGPQDRIKLVHYRPSPSTSSSSTTSPSAVDSSTDPPPSSTQGVGPHKDSSGWMTFLLQASDPSIPGLQVLSKDGLWLDAPPVPGTLVVNMGQAFEAATNGICKATTHRVLLPPGTYDRYSVPFFQGVRPDLTKADLRSLWDHFDAAQTWKTGRESAEGRGVDSPFLRGGYETWGEAQLRTKIRSHRDVGARWYADVYDKYVNDD